MNIIKIEELNIQDIEEVSATYFLVAEDVINNPADNPISITGYINVKVIKADSLPYKELAEMCKALSDRYRQNICAFKFVKETDLSKEHSYSGRIW